MGQINDEDWSGATLLILGPSLDGVAGNLQGRTTSIPFDNFASNISEADAPYVWQVKPWLEIHGLCHGRRATLLLFDMKFAPKIHNIQTATLNFNFKSRNSEKTEDDPRVSEFEPGSPPLLYDITGEDLTTGTSETGNAGFQGFGANVSGSLTRNQTAQTSAMRSGKIKAWEESLPEAPEHMIGITWRFESNPSRKQKLTVLPTSCVGLMLIRSTNEPFACTIQANVQVDNWPTTAMDWCKRHVSWGKRVYLTHYTPGKPRFESSHPSVDADHLETLLLNRNKALKAMVCSRMPSKYNISI